MELPPGPAPTTASAALLNSDPIIIQSPPPNTSATQPRKKRKRDIDPPSDLSFVLLTRDQLLEMSSIEFEDHVRSLEAQRTLTLLEKEEIKRQRKLIKNREYAQTSRMKKRETLSTLKSHVGKITIKNEILKTQVVHLSQRVQYLEQENNHLRSLLSDQRLSYPALASPEASAHYAPAMVANQPGFTPLDGSVLPNYGLAEGHPQQVYPNLPMPPNYPHLPAYGAALPMAQPLPGAYSAPPCGYPINLSPAVSLDSPDSSVYSETGSPVSTDDNILGVIPSDSDDSLPLDLDPSYGTDQLLNGWGFSDNYTRGICLLVIIFSFGIFFSMPGDLSGHTASTARTLTSMDKVLGVGVGVGDDDKLFVPQVATSLSTRPPPGAVVSGLDRQLLSSLCGDQHQNHWNSLFQSLNFEPVESRYIICRNYTKEVLEPEGVVKPLLEAASGEVEVH
uniref:BZIP domain-containing protein n=1 Tax=Arcella intermedia TaxID=1963864 RepID=A0A6B2L316_9EUKA